MNIHAFLATFRRPRLLVRAARHGLADYVRSRDLARISGHNPKQTAGAVIESLIQQEEELEQSRKSGDADYRAAHHIELLVALMAECKLLPRRPHLI